MEQVEIKRRESSIVLVGTFNPLVMAPHWFVKQGMIPQEDIEESLQIDLVYKELTRFSLANISIEIQEKTIILRSDHESFDYKIHDLAIGILSSLKDAAVTAIGLNLYTDCYFEDVKFWHRIGDRLAPKNLWLDAVPDSPHVGMANLQMQLMRPEGEPGMYNFAVSWLDAKQWIRFTLNNHFDSSLLVKVNSGYPKKHMSPPSGFDPVAIVSGCWQQSLDFQRYVVAHILNQVREAC